jgi:hypothetical protein
VQESVSLIFSKFLELGSARQTLLWFLEQGLQVPVARARGPVIWRRPGYGNIHKVLSNPIYSGAYAYGKTEHTTVYEQGQPRRQSRRKPRDQWWALIPNVHEGYISWKQFEEIQQMMTSNAHRGERSGAAKRGWALLSGLLRCGRCGRKLMVGYTGNGPFVLRYTCQRGQLDNGDARCISFAGLGLDEAISKEILQVVEPATVEAAVLASRQESLQQDEVLAALQRELEAAQYAARRAAKQYDATDPENRLVADELERRWNLALQQVQQVELRIQQQVQRRKIAPITEDEFVGLANELEAVWNDPLSDVRLKKRIVRTLLEEVVVDVDLEGGEIIAWLHWKGGVHTELRLLRRRRGQNRAQTPKEVVKAVRSLARICTDDTIAGVLTRNGLLTGRGNRWTRERVVALRSHHAIPCYSEDRRRAEGWVTLTEAAAELGVSGITLRLAIKRGEIEADHPLTDGPWVLNRQMLESTAAAQLVERAHRHKRAPALASQDQASLDLSTT